MLERISRLCPAVGLTAAAWSGLDWTGQGWTPRAAEAISARLFVLEFTDAGYYKQ